MSFHGSLVFLVFPERVRFTRFQSQTSASLFLHHISWFSPVKLRKKKVGSVQSEGKKRSRSDTSLLNWRQDW